MARHRRTSYDPPLTDEEPERAARVSTRASKRTVQLALWLRVHDRRRMICEFEAPDAKMRTSMNRQRFHSIASDPPGVQARRPE
jgi:hypothetical protein